MSLFCCQTSENFPSDVFQFGQGESDVIVTCGCGFGESLWVWVWFVGVGAFSVNLSPLSTIHRGEKIKPTVCSTHPTCVYFVLWEDFYRGRINQY